MLRLIGDDVAAMEQLFDLRVFPIGFESRCLSCLRKTEGGSKNIGILFPGRHLLSFKANLDYAKQINSSVVPLSDFPRIFQESLRDLPDRGTVFVDISSMSRKMLASVCWGLHAWGRRVRVTFGYCVAHYDDPSDIELPVVVSEPVSPEFSGWSTHPERPTAAIVGLGFEEDHAFGTLEFLEPQAAWAFFPVGTDPRYEGAVERANSALFSVLPQGNIYRYDVTKPADLIATLDALVSGISGHSRPVIVPFGPKVFSLAALLVAVLHSPSVAVWRVSGEQTGRPRDRRASDVMTAITVEMGRSIGDVTS